MFAIIVTEKGGDQRRMEFDKSEVTIGRVQGNDIILPKGNVSKRHARIVLKDGKFIIVDLKSTNGTYVNGRKITSPLVVKDSDKIYIGDFILGVDEASIGGGMPAFQPPPPEPPAPPPPPPAPVPVPEPMRAAPVRTEPPRPPAPAATLPPPEPMRREPPPAPRPAAPTPAPPPPAPAPPPAIAEAPPRPVPSPGAPPSARAPVAVQPPVERPRQRLVGAGARRASTGAPIDRAAPIPRPAPRAASAVAHGVHIEPLGPRVVKMLELQRSILDRVVARMDLDNVPLDRLGDEDLWERTEGAIVDMVETLESSGELPADVDQDTLIKEAINEALGLGPLEDLLADESVEEILVDRRDRIVVSRDGQLSGAGTAFSSDQAFRRVVERLVAPTGGSIDEHNPLIDTRLRDGTRVTAAVPPVAVHGACLTLRRPKSRGFTLGDLIESGTMSAQMGDFLETCVSARRNVLVCGGGESGKSAVVAALAAASPAGERIVSVEEVAELAIGRNDWVALEARPVVTNGAAAVDVGALLRSALRMRPDRLVVGDVRGAEALELVSAMASSADGSVASIGGEGAAAALTRLAAMARLGVPGVSADSLRDLVAVAIDVVVHVTRYADGVFRVASISEVRGATAEGYDVQELFSFRGPGDGFGSAGVIPGFYADLEARGIPADTSIFRT